MTMLRSPWPSLAPYTPQSLPDLLRRTAKRLPDKPALIEPGGCTYTFFELWRAIDAVAAWLQRQGIGRGDVVAIFAPNSIEYALALQGAIRAGATVTTINPLYRERELEHHLRDTGATLLFTTDGLAATVAGVAPRFDRAPLVVDLASVREIAAAGGAPERVRIEPERDIAVLPHGRRA